MDEELKREMILPEHRLTAFKVALRLQEDLTWGQSDEYQRGVRDAFKVAVETATQIFVGQSDN